MKEKRPSIFKRAEVLHEEALRASLLSRQLSR